MATDRRQAGQDKGNKNRIIYKGLWTADEDAQLRDRVSVDCGLIRGDRWRAVAEAFPGKTPKQCRLRWMETLRWNPRLARSASGVATGAKWAPAEERTLVRAVRKRAPPRSVPPGAPGADAVPFVVPSGDLEVMKRQAKNSIERALSDEVRDAQLA